jgi:hypothetical protein
MTSTAPIVRQDAVERPMTDRTAVPSYSRVLPSGNGAGRQRPGGGGAEASSPTGKERSAERFRCWVSARTGGAGPYGEDARFRPPRP